MNRAEMRRKAREQEKCRLPLNFKMQLGQVAGLTGQQAMILQTKCNVGLIGAGDWLVERGWVLLHNPSRGIAFPTKNPVKEYTKAQKEFLYDYYMERDCKKEANAIWKESDKR